MEMGLTTWRGLLDTPFKEARLVQARSRDKRIFSPQRTETTHNGMLTGTGEKSRFWKLLRV